MVPSHCRCRSLAIALAATAWMAVAAALAADEAARSFDVPAGDAGEALRQFVQQAGSEIMFLSGSLGGVTTAAVKGDYTARAALDRMVAATDLAVTQDPATGAFAITRRAPADRTVRLPPYLVTDSVPLKWRYVSLPGFEILSCGRSAETVEFVDEVYRQQAWLDEIVPPELQARQAVPTAMILFSPEVRKAISANISRLAAAKAAETNRQFAAAGLRIQAPATDPMPQIKLWDEDSTGVDVVLQDWGPGRYNDIRFSPDHVFFLLARRAPPLPAWFVAGVLGLYQTRLPQHPLQTRQFFSPVPWIAPEVTAALREDHAAPPTLLALGDLLGGPMPAASSDRDKRAWLAERGLGVAGGEGSALVLSPAQARLVLARGSEPGSPWRRDAWASQCLLFVRWALDDASYERRKSLWQFVARASVEPVTERAFADCFGLGFGGAARRLDGYLATAADRVLVLVPATPLDIPWIELRDPTEAEQARILGDWERKEFEFVRASHPEYAEAYARQANRTFTRAYDDGVRDPDFLAALGIYECTVGDDARAREVLEPAVRAGVARPRAYVELARIRYGEALGQPGGPDGRLDARQVDSVLDLLQAGRAQLPPLVAVYARAAEVWEHAAAAPSRADLLMLEEGRRYFPGDARLALAVARLRGRLEP